MRNITELIRKHIYNISMELVGQYIKSNDFKGLCEYYDNIPKRVLEFFYESYNDFIKVDKLHTKLWQKYYDEIKIDEVIKKNHNDLYYYHKSQRESIVIEHNGERQVLEFKGSEIEDTWIPCIFGGITYSANVWTDSNYENGADGEDEITLCSIYTDTEDNGIDMDSNIRVTIESSTYPLSKKNKKGEWIIKG